MTTALLHTDISSMSWKTFDKRRGENPLVIIPTGAVEVYGPHLPLASDTIVAQGVARLVAERMQGLCAPALPVGYSADLMSFPGTLNVSPEVFLNYLDGICRSLIHWGLKKYLFLNTHLGNVSAIDEEADLLTCECEATCMQIDWWRYASRVASQELESGSWAAGHAGELGTSVLLYFAPELVITEDAIDFEPATNPWPSGLTRYESYRKITESGVLGQPSAASQEKGRAIIECCLEAIVEDCQAFFK